MKPHPYCCSETQCLSDTYTKTHMHKRHKSQIHSCNLFVGARKLQCMYMNQLSNFAGGKMQPSPYMQIIASSPHIIWY